MEPERLIQRARTAGPPPAQARTSGGGPLLLVAAAVLLAVLWGGALPDLARISFAWHMILHLGVLLGAAPLLAFGIMRTWRPRLRHPVALAVAGGVFEALVVWGWHLPRLHEAAAFSPPLFALQQGMFLAAGAAVWLPGAGAGPRSAVAGLLAMLLAFLHMTMLGVLLTLAPGLLYAPEVCGSAFGLDPLGNQRLGGAMMAVAGIFPYLLGALASARRLLGPD